MSPVAELNYCEMTTKTVLETRRFFQCVPIGLYKHAVSEMSGAC